MANNGERKNWEKKKEDPFQYKYAQCTSINLFFGFIHRTTSLIQWKFLLSFSLFVSQDLLFLMLHSASYTLLAIEFGAASFALIEKKITFYLWCGKSVECGVNHVRWLMFKIRAVYFMVSPMDKHKHDLHVFQTDMQLQISKLIDNLSEMHLFPVHFFYLSPVSPVHSILFDILWGREYFLIIFFCYLSH